MTPLQIKLARVKKGWTQEQLAKKAGLGRQSVVNAESEKGKIQTRYSTIEKIKKALE